MQVGRENHRPGPAREIKLAAYSTCASEDDDTQGSPALVKE